MKGISSRKILPPDLTPESIEKQKQAFLEAGGKIEIIPIGKTAKKYGSTMNESTMNTMKEKQENGLLAAQKNNLRIGKKSKQDG